MEKINGIKSLELGFEIKKIGDLLYEEGPILSHFINNRNEDFLFSWVDENEEFHRWMLFKISTEQLHLFFQEQLTIKNLIQSTIDGIVYFIDIDAALNYQNFTITTIPEIPVAYLPPKASYFKEAVFENYAMNLKNYLEIHFKRSSKFYSMGIPSSLSVAEPISPYKKKKKKL